MSRASSPVSHALTVELNRPTVRLSRVCLLFLLLCHFFCSCVAFFAFSLAPLLYPQLYLTVSMHSTQLRGLLLSLYLPPTTKAAAVVCNYDLQHGPPWLLLLSFIVNQLLIVYHAVLLLCHSYHPAHAFVWAQYSTRYMKFSRYTCEDSSIFILCFVFFFISSSDLAHSAPITNSVAVRLFAPDRDSCVLASCGLPLVLLQ